MTDTEDKAKEPTEKPTEENSTENLEEIKRLENEKEETEKKYRAHIEQKLKECDFDMLDGINGRRYSFKFKGQLFVFNIPTLMEKTQIKLILSNIAKVLPGNVIISAAELIQGSGDLDLVCSSKLVTHIKVLKEEPERFEADDLDDIDQYELGYLILITEREFLDQKKKVSTSGQ